MSQLLVSCIMPTKNRREFVPRAIERFQVQTYANKELVIVDDGTDNVIDLMPYDPQVRYIRVDPRKFSTLGAKRNACVGWACGDLIMHWDDDDWYRRDRIELQIRALTSKEGDICGLKSLIYKRGEGDFWLYTWNGPRSWIAGGTFLYTREFWESHPFPDQQVGSDTAFLWGHKGGRRVILNDPTFYVATMHEGNTSPINIKEPDWKPYQWDMEIAKYSLSADEFNRMTQRRSH